MYFSKKNSLKPCRYINTAFPKSTNHSDRTLQRYYVLKQILKLYDLDDFTHLNEKLSFDKHTLQYTYDFEGKMCYHVCQKKSFMQNHQYKNNICINIYLISLY